MYVQDLQHLQDKVQTFRSDIIFHILGTNLDSTVDGSTKLCSIEKLAKSSRKYNQTFLALAIHIMTIVYSKI